VPVVWCQISGFPMTASQEIRKDVLRDELITRLAENLPSG